MGIFEVFDWVSGPARPKIDELERRWAALFDWGLKEKVPALKPNWEDWEAYADRSRYDLDFLIDHLNGQIDQLQKVESTAKQSGFAGATPTLEHIDPGRATADRSLGTGVREAAEKAGGKVPSVPWLAIGIGASVTLVVIGAVGIWTAKQAAPVVLPLATGGVVRLPREEASRT